MATTMYAETLEHIQHKTQLIPESRNHTDIYTFTLNISYIPNNHTIRNTVPYSLLSLHHSKTETCSFGPPCICILLLICSCHYRCFQQICVLKLCMGPVILEGSWQYGSISVSWINIETSYISSAYKRHVTSTYKSILCNNSVLFYFLFNSFACKT